MTNVGRSQAGNTLIGQGVLAGPRFAAIGTDSGLTQNGVVVAEGSGPFTATAAGNTGQILMGNTGANPSFQTGGTVVGQTITGDSGLALSPTAGNWNIVGGPGVTTSGSGSTLTINSVVFTDTTAATLAVDNGYNATAAGTYNLPATAAQGELIIIFCDTAGAVVVDAPALNFIRIGNAITSSGGTATSTLQGDSLTLRYRLSSLTWEMVGISGNWITA